MIKQDRGIFDTFPLSLITTQTIARLGEMVGARLCVERFRPNILVEAVDPVAFSEDSWVGSRAMAAMARRCRSAEKEKPREAGLSGNAG